MSHGSIHAPTTGPAVLIADTTERPSVTSHLLDAFASVAAALDCDRRLTAKSSPAGKSHG